MDFAFSPTCQDLQKKLLAFMDESVRPAEPVWEEQMARRRRRTSTRR